MVCLRMTAMGLALSYMVSGVAVAGASRTTTPRPRRPTVYKWQTVPNAAYYSGRYVDGESVVTFRTSSNWIMLRAVNSIEIKAFGEDGRPLLGTTMITASSPREHLTAVSTNPHLSPEQSLASELAAGKDWDPLSDDEANVSTEAKFGRHPEHPMRLQLSLQLATGRENLGSQAGIDSYHGSANIGSTALNLEWQPANAFWYVAANAESHDLPITPADASASASTFRRTTGRTFLFYDVGGSSGRELGALGVGLGIIHTGLPVMGITDHDKGSATLRMQSVTGPGLAIEASGKLGDRSSLIGWISYQPTSFAPSIKALSAMAETTIRWQFAPSMFAELGGTWHWYRIQSAQACTPAECHNFSQSISTVFMLEGGVGVKF